MALKIKILVMACLFVVLPIALATCPSKEDVAPCICRDPSRGAYINCNKIDDKELAKVASSLRGMSFFSFIIENGKLGVIPNDIFKGVQVKQIFIDKSTLSALTDKGEAFVGLEDHLESIRMADCTFKNEWDWSVLKSLKKLKSLNIRNSLNLETLGSNVMKDSISSSLERFFSAGNNIIYLYDRAFDSFKNLGSLTLTISKNKNLKRAMFPNPALKLTSLTLTSSLIEQIPEDMFTNMPNLRILNFSFDRILVLNERTFSPVWEQLQSFYISGNPLRCDCTMSWLTKKRTVNVLFGQCASPPELQGKELSKLTSKDFVC